MLEDTRRGRLRGRIAVAAVAVACAATLSCSRDASAEATGETGGAGIVEVSDLGRQVVSVGTSLSGDVLPLIGHGGEEGPARAYLVASGSSGLQALPDLPHPIWFADSYSVASERWVLISAATCPEVPIEEDLGVVCGDGRSTSDLFAFDRVDERWLTVRYPDNRGNVAEPLNIAGDVALLKTAVRDADDQALPRLATLDLSSENPTLEMGDEPPGITCTIRQVPPATFDSAEDPRTITFSTPGSDEQQVMDLPPAARPPGTSPPTWPTPYCFTAGPFLLTMSPEDLTLSPEDVEDGPPATSILEVPYHVFSPLTSGEPIHSGIGNVTSLHAGPDYVVIELNYDLVVVDDEGDAVDRVAVPSDVGGTFSIGTLEGSWILLLRGPNGVVQSMETRSVAS